MMDEFQFDILYQYDPNPEVLSKFRDAGFNCIRVPSKIQHPFRHLWAIYRLFKKKKYDIVHSHLEWGMNSYICILAFLAGIKKRIAHNHQAYGLSSKRTLKNWIWSILCPIIRIPCKLFATHWLACGQAAAICGWGKRALNKGKVLFLPNAVDSKRFKYSDIVRQEIRIKFGIAKDDFVIGHVGRFYSEKNHEFLVNVFNDLKKKNNNAKLLLLGDGPLQERIMQDIKSLGLSESVIFAGLQKDSALFYSAMDVFCLPSLREGLPLTLVEAQYAALPCLVSDNVTKEINISKQVLFIPLLKNDWVAALLKMSKKKRLEECTSNLFDISVQYKILKQIYLK